MAAAAAALISGLLAPDRGAVVVFRPGHAEPDEAASEEICALYYVEGDPTAGHRSQRATLFADHQAADFELEAAGGGHIKVAQQTDHLRLAGVTGCVVWNGAVVLAKTLGYWDEVLGVLSLEGLVVLELGAGTGLLALAAAALGARDVATEQAERLKLLCRNVERHAAAGGVAGRWSVGRLGGAVEVRELDWFAPGEPEECDLILASDVVYTEEVAAALVRCLAAHAAPAVLAIELRTEEVHYAFIEALAAASFVVYRLPVSMLAEDVRTKRVVMYVLTREDQP